MVAKADVNTEGSITCGSNLLWQMVVDDERRWNGEKVGADADLNTKSSIACGSDLLRGVAIERQQWTLTIDNKQYGRVAAMTVTMERHCMRF